LSAAYPSPSTIATYFCLANNLRNDCASRAWVLREHEPIRRTAQLRDNSGRARIRGDGAAARSGTIAHEVHVAPRFFGQGGVRHLQQPADALFILAAALRLAEAQVVRASTRVCVEVEERRRLFFEVLDELDQQDVLEHVREIAGVVRVAVVHVDATMGEACDVQSPHTMRRRRLYLTGAVQA
jgi:hypothetical protein